MSSRLQRKLRKALRNLPNLLQGYNLYVNRDKLSLIDLTFRVLSPGARSFADLGGAWKVNGAYSLYTMRSHPIRRGFIVDTDIPPALLRRLASYAALEAIREDFASMPVVRRIGTVDVAYLFDVLLHQANPDWDQVLERYAATCSCFVIYNQQFIRGSGAVRLTELPYDDYVSLTSGHAEELIRYVYSHRDEIHPFYKKPWKDIHNIAQWGITDDALRAAMSRLGFREVYFRNHGLFVGLPAFEEHAFVFVRRP